METRTFKLFFLWLYPLSLLAAPGVVSLGSGVSATARLTPFACPLHWLTGWLCPTCGLGRSLVAVWAGEYQASWDFHFLGPIIFVGAALIWVSTLFNKNAYLFSLSGPLTQAFHRQTIPIVTLYGLWGLWRNF